MSTEENEDPQILCGITPELHYPSELPENPERVGWHRRLIQHLDFGRNGGAAVYQLVDECGSPTPILWQYDTRREPRFMRGFVLAGTTHNFRTWEEVRDFWPTYLKEKGIQP